MLAVLRARRIVWLRRNWPAWATAGSKLSGQIAANARQSDLCDAPGRECVPCMDGGRGARGIRRCREGRVRSCIRPIGAAVVAAGHDVIR